MKKDKRTKPNGDMIFPCTNCKETGILNEKHIPYNQPCPYCEGMGYISWIALSKKKLKTLDD